MRLRLLLGPKPSPLVFAAAAIMVCASAAAHMPTTPTGAGVVYNAGLEGFEAGSGLPTDSSGESRDRPSSIDGNLTAIVADAASVPQGTPAINGTRFARLQEACGEAPNLDFDRGIALGTAASPNAIAHVAFDVLFERLENYQMVFRNGSGSGIPGPASQSVADIDTASNGSMTFSSLGGQTTIAYQAGVTYHIDAFFDLGNNRWYAFVNGARVVNGTSIIDSPLGLVGLGFNFSSFCPPSDGASFAGVMQFDDFLFEQVAAIPVVAADPTIAGLLNGLGTPFGVAVHGGFAYVADPPSHTVWQVSLTPPFDKVPVAGIGWRSDVDPQDRPGYNGDGIPATQAQLDNPRGVAIDPAGSGTLYIADTGNHAVRRVALGMGSSATITTVAGIPTSYGVVDQAAFAACSNQCPATSLRLFNPRAVAVDRAGNLYIADEMNYQVKRVDKATGFITVVAGVAGEPSNNDGPVAGPAFCAPGDADCTPAAKLNAPVGVAVDAEGIVYIADWGNNRIRIVSDGSVRTLQAGALVRPTGVAVTTDGGTVYIADYGTHRILRASDCGAQACTVATVAGTGTPGSSGVPGGPATQAQLNSPIAVTLDGNLLYIVDHLNGRIVIVDVTAAPAPIP